MRPSRLITALSLILSLAGARVGIGIWQMQPDLAIPAKTYTSNGDWAAIPDPLPEPVWLTGWKTDVFFLSYQNEISGTSQPKIRQRMQNAKETTQLYKAALEPYGALYAPLLRDGHSDDAATALNAYLDHYNQGRAFVIVSNTAPTNDLTAIITALTAQTRFGGYYFTSADVTSAARAAGTSTCPARFNHNCQDTIELTFLENSVSTVMTETDSTEGMFKAFEAYLKNDTRPMAEPFGDFEEIEIISIKKPGQLVE